MNIQALDPSYSCYFEALDLSAYVIGFQITIERDYYSFLISKTLLKIDFVFPPNEEAFRIQSSLLLLKKRGGTSPLFFCGIAYLAWVENGIESLVWAKAFKDFEKEHRTRTVFRVNNIGEQ